MLFLGYLVYFFCLLSLDVHFLCSFLSPLPPSFSLSLSLSGDCRLYPTSIVNIEWYECVGHAWGVLVFGIDAVLRLWTQYSCIAFSEFIFVVADHCSVLHAFYISSVINLYSRDPYTIFTWVVIFTCWKSWKFRKILTQRKVRYNV